MACDVSVLEKKTKNQEIENISQTLPFPTETMNNNNNSTEVKTNNRAKVIDST